MIRRIQRLAIAAVLFLTVIGGRAAFKAQVATDGLPPIGQKYSELQAGQKRLVDDWFARLSQLLKKEVSAVEGYNRLPLSSKTSFSAVTHALLRTPLTDMQGATLADSALALVAKLDDVAGKVAGARGDEQFRIYVQLRPGAVELLNQSKQFSREDDNTVYHRGFPICYRGRGGAPSIQISVSRNSQFADIDVDYRSSKFPAALFNGHLSASNSDVRAGDNDQRHNRRWQGLGNWWRTLLGLPFIPGKSAGEEKHVLAREPRIEKNAKPAAVVNDFLNSWLVERRPEVTLGYFSQSAFPCIEVESGLPLDRGMARVQILNGLQTANRRLGSVTSLSQAVVAAPLNSPRAKVLKQPHHEQFELYDVREDLAEDMKCANRLDPENISLKAARSQEYEKYVAAVFKLKAGEQLGETVATLWSKEADRWKLVSYDVEPELEQGSTSARVAPFRPQSPAVPYVEGDPELIRAAEDFADTWLVHKLIDRAFAYFASNAYPCVNLYREEDTPEARTPAEQGELMKKGMQKVATKLGTIKRLEQSIAAPQPSHSDLKLIRHAKEQAFALVSIPEYMAAAADCVVRSRGEETVNQSKNKSYGRFYAMGFKLAGVAGDPPVLWLVWDKQGADWKIISYGVLAP